MLPYLVSMLPFLVTSSLGNCGGGRWPSHVYEARTEILEGGEVIIRDNTTFEISKNGNETVVEEVTARVTTFDDYENDEAVQEQRETPDYHGADTGHDMLDDSFDAETGNGYQSFSGMYFPDDDDDDSNENEMDGWTKRHYKKIKGLRMLQNVTQDLVLPQSGKLVCWANVCHELDVVIHRVKIVATVGVTIQCLDGGIGSYKMAFEVKGQPGKSGVITAKMWGAYVLGHFLIWVTSGGWQYQCGEVINHC